MKVEMLVRRIVHGRVELSVEMVDASWEERRLTNSKDVIPNITGSIVEASSIRVQDDSSCSVSSSEQVYSIGDILNTQR